MTRLALGGGALACLIAVPAVAQDDNRHPVIIAPYIEVSQTMAADLNGGGVLTYTSAAAGIDVSADTARTSAQLSYRYERNFAENRGISDDDTHYGLARVAVKLAPGLTIDGGAIATRTRSDIGGAAPVLQTANDANVTQVYSAYVGPSFAGKVGMADVSGDYHASFTKVEAPNGTGVAPGTPQRDNFDRDIAQEVNARVGVAPGVMLPVGLAVSGGYARDDANQLDQRFEDGYVRGDALLPVSRTVGLTGGVGYEKLTSSQRDPLRDAAGLPVVDNNGRYVTDPTSPRRVSYRTDGVYFDAGVVWKPSHRTTLTAAVGRRYGSTSYTGSLSYQASQSVGLSVVVYDQVTTFGQQLKHGLSNLPTSFLNTRDAFDQQFSGCVYGTSGAAPGGCLNDAFQSVSTATYRARGVSGTLSATRGLSSYGVGAGYENRELFAPNAVSNVFAYGDRDQSFYGQLFYSRQLSRVSGVDANLVVSYYEPGSERSDNVWSYGATASYYHNFGHLGASATAGIYNYKVGDQPSVTSAQAVVGARYTF